MRSLIVTGCFLISACGNNEAEVSKTSRTTNSTNTTATTAPTVSDDTNISFAKEADAIEAPLVPVIKRPSGIYQFLLPGTKEKILHTVAFYPASFSLQEEYIEKRDSVITTKGTWSPSQGYIWLYKDQLARARYTWSGDTLQYYSPELKKSFSMTMLTPAGNNAVWQQKRKAGVLLFGVGTEPFWSIEVNKMDSLTFSTPEWQQPLKVKLSEIKKSRDSSTYHSVADSIQLITYPFLCNDGMSDFIYTSRMKFIYKGQTYEGCGVVF